ncbi:hypothetical protein P8452_37987 [Trifolium repens]|nr:hypothetical protein P8452_37987 [Trifolium repens]
MHNHSTPSSSSCSTASASNWQGFVIVSSFSIALRFSFGDQPLLAPIFCFSRPLLQWSLSLKPLESQSSLTIESRTRSQSDLCLKAWEIVVAEVEGIEIVQIHCTTFKVKPD